MTKNEMNKLKKLCEDYLNWIASDDYHGDNDWPHYIYEAALEAVHGPDVWEKIKNIHKQREIASKKAEIEQLEGEIASDKGS